MRDSEASYVLTRQLVQQARQEGDVDGLRRAVHALAALVDLGAAPPAHVATVGTAWYWLFEATGDPAPMRAAEHAYRKALDRAAGSAPPIWRSHLGMCLLRVSERMGRRGVLEEALQLLRSAAGDLGADAPGYFEAQANLGLGLLRTMEHTSRLDLLPGAVAAHRAAADAVPGRPDAAAQILSNLANTLMYAWDHTGGRKHLTEALEAARAAVALVPPDHPAVPGCLAALGRVLTALAQVTGDQKPLLEAVHRLHSCLRDVPSNDPDRPLWLSWFATACRVLFTRTGDVAALDEAIGARREAAWLLPDDHPDVPAYRGNLAIALRNRYDALADTAALDESVRLLRDVVAQSAPDDPEHSRHQADLANALHRRGVSTADPDVLDEAAELLRTAAGTTVLGRPERLMHLANLGSVLLSAATLTPAAAGLSRAIAVLSEAVGAAGPEDPELAEALLNLGRAHELGHQRTGERDAQEEAARAYERLVSTRAAPAQSRALAAQALGHLRLRAGDSREALDGFTRAIDLLDLVAWLGLRRDDQERLLGRFPALATTAAACAIELGDLDTAVEVLERGRGVMVAQALGATAGTDHVRRRVPELADRLDALHRLLESGEREGSATAWSRQSIVLERDAVLAEIRATDQLSDFLRAPRVAALRAGLGDRTVVIVNVAPQRCDALVLTSTATTCLVPLPGLTVGDVTRHASDLAEITDEGLLETLAWLWDAVTGPVLARCAQIGVPVRLWWMPTGPLSFLPVHAAGHHRAGEGTSRSAVHQVISSYATTLRSLEPGAPRLVRSPLTVAVPQSDDDLALPGARREADIVARHLGDATVAVAADEATRRRVLDLLAEADWAHFACHATTDLARPSDSHLSLHDGPLRVRDLFALRNATTRTRALAYLSACSTARGGPGLPDENIHLASALQWAGFSDVIATFWPMPDAVAVRAADRAYAHMRDTTPARALQATVSELYDRYPERPTAWAAHLHLGADHSARFG
ncbi:CHAT domain-containing protein [Micromonospora sp. 4G57]|uniref:CHAT domain-containing protein n=1 Tax=Micromonospora sicca TaxID=2202420 RepID=A0ABU5JN87_9ACTN|nr:MULTISPECIES: CHAT domain-containing protein [unclassified Micromonospora]MDZ5446511.1 CHAT domain-containing protein [Micromonospora sp. 4G57]MDZ5494036.1 CHAT domain-containing protein [Micromonospora sp. 4G53]